MKGIFWNCRGLRDLAKHTFLHDVTEDRKLDFIALSDTNRNSFSTQCLENFCAGADFVWHWRCPRGMSGDANRNKSRVFRSIKYCRWGVVH
jgi:hypothetical protein